MGLFGYNEKDYNKNTTVFADQLNNMFGMCGTELGARKLLSSAMMAMQYHGYPGNKNSKVQKEIDERIKGIIASLDDDLVHNQVGKFTERIKMLTEAIDSRRKGAEVCDTQEIELQKTNIECMGSIVTHLERQKQIAIEKEEILKEADACKGTVSEVQERKRLGLKYNALDAEEKQLTYHVNALTQTYNNNLDVINTKRSAKNAKELPKMSVVTSIESYRREVEKTNQLYADHYEKQMEISDVTKSFTSTMDSVYGEGVGETSKFDAIMGARDEAKVMENLANATGAGQGASNDTVDPFTQAMNGR